MKKLLLILLIGVSACTASPDNTAKKLVRNYLQKELDNPKSYQEVEWGKLDSVQVISDDSINKLMRANKEFQKFIDNSNAEWEELNARIELLERNKDSLSDYEQQLDKLEKEKIKSFERDFLYTEDLKKSFHGWQLPHSYCATNEYNATVLFKDTFYLDKELTKVLSKKAAE